MRIKGLVRAFNQVRLQLQAGLRPEDAERFRRGVESILRDVEEICRNHGITPDRLPAPSRIAYVFLKELDLDNLPMAAASENAMKPSVVRIKNVVKIGDSFADRLWQNRSLLISSTGKRQQLSQELDGHVSTIERVCQEQGVTPAAMEVPSKQIYCWLKFLSIADNLMLHLEALQRASQAVDEQRPRPSHPVLLHLICMNALWRKRQYQNVLLLKVNQGFLGADQYLWRAIIHNIVSGRNVDHNRLIREYAESDDFSELLFEVESFASSTSEATKGRAHNLDESFDRINSSYFGGQMPRPKIVWNRTPTVRKFGHYQPGRDTLMVSITLDDPRVPGYVIDFVMYHELLHKKHGIAATNGRRQAHGPGFRIDERQFVYYNEATSYINQLALKHRIMDQPADPMHMDEG